MNSVAVIVTGMLAAGTIAMIAQSEHDNPPAHINGTVVAVNHYPGHKRAGLTGAYINDIFREATDPKTGVVTDVPATYTGVVQWNPATEVCFRFDNGTAGCRYTAVDVRTLEVGQRIDEEQVAGEFCAPHPAPSDEVADRDCPAFADDGEPVVNVKRVASGVTS